MEYESLLALNVNILTAKSAGLTVFFLSAESFSFALQGRLQGGDEEEDSFVWIAVMLLKDCEKAWLAWGFPRG